MDVLKNLYAIGGRIFNCIEVKATCMVGLKNDLT
jgi:hypothetical protein